MSDTVLVTPRLVLRPLDRSWSAEHDEDECRGAEEHWRVHGFGPWAILEADAFVGVAEVHFAYPGVTGITTDEIEVGWTIAEPRRGGGLATEAMEAAIADVWQRARTEHVVAYIRPENAASHRVAEKLGFAVRGGGLTRSGDPMTVYELRRASPA